MRHRQLDLLCGLLAGLLPLTSYGADSLLERHARRFAVPKSRYEREMRDIAKSMREQYGKAHRDAVRAGNLDRANLCAKQLKELEQRNWPLLTGSDPVAKHYRKRIRSLRETFALEVVTAWSALWEEYEKEKQRALTRRDVATANELAAQQRLLTTDWDLLERTFGDVPLARVTLRPGSGVKITDLRVGVQRLHNFADSKISSVRMRDAVFTAVPWQSRPTHHVGVVTDGLLYAVSLGKAEGADGEDEMDRWPEAKGLLRGKYLGGVRARFVRAGDSFRLNGYECVLIAAEIRQ